MQNNAYWKTGSTVCKITSGTEEYMLQEIREEKDLGGGGRGSGYQMILKQCTVSATKAIIVLRATKII